jgi:pimeloyl-ACP methyl ester carboxylesterase
MAMRDVSSGWDEERAVEAEEINLHGNRVSFLRAGDGPAVLLLHGIAGSFETWAPLIPALSDEFTVIAPDMLGHGSSAKPRGDYSLGAYAAGARDLLLALGHESATVVGHSLGGGVAMQFSYQFPLHTERLALVSSGGLGDEVNIVLRAATLPGSELVLPLITKAWVTGTGRRIAGLLDAIGLKPGADITEIARGYASLADPEARQAFIHTARSVIDHRGQRVSARDRLYLAESLPSLIVWGDRDRIIPSRHGIEAAREMPGSRFELFEGAGHFPHLQEPIRFSRLLARFINETEPARLDGEEVRKLLEARSAA